MKKQIPTTKTLLHSAVVLIATAVVSSASAATVAYGDFNNDGLMDMAAITSPTTITIRLANPDGSYTVSAILTGSKNQSISGVSVFDYNADGKLDILGGAGSGGPKFSSNIWLGNGDGTFGNRKTVNSNPFHHGFF